MLSIIRLIVGRCVAQVMYDRACKFWHFLYSIFQEYRLMSGRQWMMFYATEMRFFRQMLMAAKVLLGPINSDLSSISRSYSQQRGHWSYKVPVRHPAECSLMTFEDHGDIYLEALHARSLACTLSHMHSVLAYFHTGMHISNSGALSVLGNRADKTDGHSTPDLSDGSRLFCRCTRRHRLHRKQSAMAWQW